MRKDKTLFTAIWNNSNSGVSRVLMYKYILYTINSNQLAKNKIYIVGRTKIEIIIDLLTDKIRG